MTRLRLGMRRAASGTRPSGLKGRSALAARRPPAAPDPGASTAPLAGRQHGQAKACPDRTRGARDTSTQAARTHYSKSLRFQGIATDR
jgi:hypothetical protein